MPGGVFLTDSNSVEKGVATNPIYVTPVSGGGATAPFNLTQVGGTNVVTGGIAGSQGIGGLVAAGVALGTVNPVPVGIASGGSLVNTVPASANVNGDGVAAGNILAAATWAWNGASFDRVRTIVGALAAGSAGTGTAATERAGTLFSQITTATSTTVKGSAGILHRVSINTPIGGATIKIYNAASATGTPITITCPATITGESPFYLDYDIYMSAGIFVVTSGLTDVTVTYR